MGRVVHFEISAEQPERAAGFYRTVFGWGIQKWEGPQDYWLVKTGDESKPGIDGGITPRSGDEHTVDTIDVESVDDTVSKVEASGGTVTVPKQAVPGVGWLAYFRDTEGNTVGILEADEQTA